MQEALLPKLSVAVQVLVITPVLPQSPAVLSSKLISGKPSVLSIAAAVPVLAGEVSLPHSTITFPGQVIIGASNLKDSNISIKKGEEDLVAEGIFNKIKGKEKARTIQLPFLQVFLDKFYMKITGDASRSAEAEFSLKALNDMGEMGDILIDFLEEQVSEISKKLKKKIKKLKVN